MRGEGVFADLYSQRLRRCCERLGSIATAVSWSPRPFGRRGETTVSSRCSDQRVKQPEQQPSAADLHAPPKPPP
jgi:hypothetical protein